MTAEHCLGREETGRTGIIMSQEQRGRRGIANPGSLGSELN